MSGMSAETTSSRLITPVCIAGYFLVVTVLFFFREPLDFFFAGHVSENLKYMMQFAVSAKEGLLPYRDVAVEYPPLAVAWLWVLAPFSGNFETYNAAFMLGMLFVSAAGLMAALQLTELCAPQMNPVPRTAIATTLYTAAVVCAGPIGLASMDFIPMALSGWALVYLLRGKFIPAALLLALATAAKGYPAVLFPLFVFRAGQISGWKSALKTAGVFIGVSILFFGGAAALSPQGMLDSFAYHSERGIEIGSTYSAAISLLKLRGAEMQVISSHGCWNLDAGSITTAAARYSTWILLFLIFAVYVRVLLFWKRGSTFSVASSAALLLAFIVGFKVGSPQFLGWLVVFIVPVAFTIPGAIAFATFCAAGILSQWIFPWHMQSMVHLNPMAIKVLAIQKALMIISFIAVAIYLQRPPGKTD